MAGASKETVMLWDEALCGLVVRERSWWVDDMGEDERGELTGGYEMKRYWRLW